MTNPKIKTRSNVQKSNNKKYDLADRIFKYAVDVLDYLDKLPQTSVNKVIIGQCARSVTSIGANYEEADSAYTRKDFSYKMGIMRKEAKETRYWLKISLVKNPKVLNEKCIWLRDECLELVRIFSSIINKTKE